MANLYLFNPENDVALGYWKGSFTLSPLVSSLRSDGASLPMWYASAGDYVLDVWAMETPQWYERMSRLFGLDVNVGGSVPKGLAGAPWGWSYDACRQLSAAGALVPDIDRLERIRDLSHRRLTAKLMSRLRGMLPFELPAVPVEACTIVEVKQIWRRYGDIFVKAPWSSSGRGVFRIDKWTDAAERRIGNILRRQGSVMCEPTVDKRRDFAMEFHSDGYRVERIAYSLFFNGRGDAYAGNILAPDPELERLLVDDGADKEHLDAVLHALEELFMEMVAPNYKGYFGVDMMISSDGMIIPCVEVNLRMTMGAVAAIWRDRYLSAGSRGRYYVGMKDGAACVRQPIVDDGRMVSGRMSLVPPRKHGMFEFVVEVSEL